jgi:hypothetical protein
LPPKTTLWKARQGPPSVVFQPGGTCAPVQQPQDTGQLRIPPGSSACFYCGDTEHRIRDCPHCPHGLCFVCFGTGHWANNCPENLGRVKPQLDHTLTAKKHNDVDPRVQKMAEYDLGLWNRAVEKNDQHTCPSSVPGSQDRGTYSHRTKQEGRSSSPSSDETSLPPNDWRCSRRRVQGTRGSPAK